MSLHQILLASQIPLQSGCSNLFPFPKRKNLISNVLALRHYCTAGVKRAVADYEELAMDPDVDIVYVSNIHPAHRDTSILMMDHGKHVLCEKPLAVSSGKPKSHA